MRNNRKKVNWVRVTLFVIVAAILGFILYTIFSPKTKVKTVSEFKTELVQSASDSTDENYVKRIKWNNYSYSAEVEIQKERLISGKKVINSHTYIVNMTARDFDAIATQVQNDSSKLGRTYLQPFIDNFVAGYNLKDGHGNTITTVIELREALKTDAAKLKTFESKLAEFKELRWADVVRLAASSSTSKIPVDQRITAQGASRGINWGELILRFLPIIIMIAFFIFLFRGQMKSMGSGIGGTSNQAVKVKTNKRFTDVAGNAEVKEEVAELVDYLKNPKKFSAAGARIPKGILLGGPPGTGKTLIAKATAGEASVPFYFISASNFVEMFVGLGAKRVRDMFKEARHEAPAIIFIDELDAIGRRRGSGVGGGNDEREQTLNQILVEMDGITDNSGILIIAATNRADILDPALLRPGRFDRTITVNLPNIKEREEILRLHARGKRLSPEINFENLAKRTPGYSGAQLENVINEAAILSVRESTNVIIPSQVDEAIDRVMSGPAKKGRVISPEELKMVAYHEAGHAVVGIKLPGGNQVQKITIIPRGNAGGYNLMLPEVEKYNMTKAEMLAMIASFMGGRAAEEIIYGEDNVSTGAGDDIAKATKIARKMVTEYGMSNLGPIKYEEDTENPFLGRDYAKASSFSSKVADEIDVAVRQIILEAQDIAIKIINENRELHELIAQALLENETIVKEEIDYIAKNLKLPPKREEIKSEIKQYSLDELIAEVSESNTEEKDKAKK